MRRNLKNKHIVQATNIYIYIFIKQDKIVCVVYLNMKLYSNTIEYRKDVLNLMLTWNLGRQQQYKHKLGRKQQISLKSDDQLWICLSDIQ